VSSKPSEDRPPVFCALRQFMTWDGRTHKEIIDAPRSSVVERLERLEKDVATIKDQLSK
jgi:hypothetical protein